MASKNLILIAIYRTKKRGHRLRQTGRAAVVVLTTVTGNGLRKERMPVARQNNVSVVADKVFKKLLSAYEKLCLFLRISIRLVVECTLSEMWA